MAASSQVKPDPVVAGAAELAASAGSASMPAAPLADADALKAWLAGAPRQENDAWQQLGTLWSLAPPDADACLAAQQQQVQCWRSSGASLATVRQLGRPVILTLHDGERRPAYAVLTALDAQHAELSAGAQAIRVPLAALAGYWRGDFAMLWRTPPGYGTKPGAANSAPADWLETQLTKIAAPAGGQAAAVPLKARIAEFQVTQGLTPDGVAGPITLMQLNRAAGIDEPRLKTETNTGK